MNAKPRVVKFSGGRSSGMMLLNLLKDGELDPKRGDVIVFNNTSAEHSETYEFTRRFKKIAEDDYGIPFFWTEFQSYEDSNSNNFWVRNPSYRLVNDKPFSKENPDGYKFKGEVFEEMISLNGYMPNMMNRSCTAAMKITVTNNFLSDWFAMKDGIDRKGHFGKASRMRDKDIIELHKRRGGGVPDDILLSKREYIRTCSHYRPEQKWEDFTKGQIVVNNPVLKNSIFGDAAELHGDNCVEYISCLGFRADEKRRLHKVKDRIETAADEGRKSFSTQPWGEEAYAPLIEKGITQEDVNEFWSKQNFDLNLPQDGLFSNCLFCPLKGSAKLLKIAYETQKNEDESSPESIDWWINIEKKYSRDLKAEKRKLSNKDKNTNYVGFFGGKETHVFQDIKDKVEKIDINNIDPSMLNIDSVPCNCTD